MGLIAVSYDCPTITIRDRVECIRITPFAHVSDLAMFDAMC
jgi:hypothetical protein